MVILLLSDFLFNFTNTLEINIFHCCWAVLVVSVVACRSFWLCTSFFRVDCGCFCFRCVVFQFRFFRTDLAVNGLDFISFLCNSLFHLLDFIFSVGNVCANFSVAHTFCSFLFLSYFSFFCSHFRLSVFMFSFSSVHIPLCISSIGFCIRKFIIDTSFFSSCFCNDLVLLFYNRISIFRYFDVVLSGFDGCICFCFISFCLFQTLIYELHVVFSLLYVLFSAINVRLCSVYRLYCACSLCSGCLWSFNRVSMCDSIYTSNTSNKSCTKSSSFHCVFHKIFTSFLFNLFSKRIWGLGQFAPFTFHSRR